MRARTHWTVAAPSEAEFQQYRGGPCYPRSLFAINIENHTKQLNEARRWAVKERRHECRGNREWNALRYLEAKRALQFLINQSP